MITTSILLYSAISTVILVVLGYRLSRSLRLFRIKKNDTAAFSAPSVSVCIPARNETHAMTQCLERVLASDYKKLEVIVFDDSSADDTSVLVRSFAHAGVRFVPGTELPEGWLGKNHALEVLAREASGSYVIFMGVDTFISPTTISQLVDYTVTEDMEMVSVIPGRADSWRFSVLFGHLRYFWELVLSRSSAPATSSSLWLIRRTTLLERFSGFEAVNANVTPEAAMAASLTSKKYHCLVNNRLLGISYEKKWHSQVETSRRLLYPMAGATWWSGILALLFLVILNAPFFLVLAGLITNWGLLHTIALGLLFAFTALYTVYTSHVWYRAWWMGGLLWPVIIFQELILFINSIMGYSRHTITWKGRLITAKSNSARAYIIDR